MMESPFKCCLFQLQTHRSVAVKDKKQEANLHNHAPSALTQFPEASNSNTN